MALRDGETQEGLLARFTKGVQRSGILKEAREHRFASNVRKSVESGCALSPTGCGERPAGRGLPLRASEAYHL